MLEVPLDYQPSDPPGEPGQLALLHEQPDAHDGDAVRAIGFVANGEQWEIVSGGEDAQIRNWDLNLSEYEARVLDHTIYDIDVRTDLFATGEGGWNGHADSPTLRLWEASGSPLTQTQVPIGFVYSVAISPDKNWTAASGFYGDIVVYQNRSNNLAPYNLELFDTTATKKKRTRALTFSPDGGILASASTGGIHLWSFPLGCAPGDCQLDALLTLAHSGSWSFPIAFAPDSPPERIEMVSGTDSGTIKFWILENLATENQTVSFHSVESGAVYALA